MCWTIFASSLIVPPPDRFGTNPGTPDWITWCVFDSRLAPNKFRRPIERNNRPHMQTFFFDMIDGVPLRDRTGIAFDSHVEAIAHSRVIAKHFRDESLRNDQDLEISVVNASGREIHREFVHREPDAAAIKK